MRIQRFCFYMLTLPLIFSVVSCGRTVAVTREAGISTETGVAFGDSHKGTLTAPETDTVPAATGIVVPQNAPLTVYVKGGNVWLWGAAASPKQLTRSGQDSSPKISDDARVIAFIRQGSLWAVDVIHGNEWLLVSRPALTRLLPADTAGLAQPHWFDFMPGTHDIYFNTAIFTGTFPLFQDNLIRVNADSAELRLLLDSTAGGRQFVFSPDRKKLALLCSDKINVVNVDGSGLKTVFTFLPVMMYSEINYIPEVVWLPDGSGFKTVIPAQDPLADPAALTRFMFISADGAIVARLAEFSASPAFANRPFISPDGSKVLYTKAHGADLELHVMDASTADQLYFSHAGDTFGILGWAPDSSRAVYWLDDRRRVWLGLQTSDAVALSDPFVDNLLWVDAQHYLFVSALELRLGTLGRSSILLDGGLSETSFDFTTVH